MINRNGPYYLFISNGLRPRQSPWRVSPNARIPPIPACRVGRSRMRGRDVGGAMINQEREDLERKCRIVAAAAPADRDDMAQRSRRGRKPVVRCNGKATIHVNIKRTCSRPVRPRRSEACSPTECARALCPRCGSRAAVPTGNESCRPPPAARCGHRPSGRPRLPAHSPSLHPDA